MSNHNIVIATHQNLRGAYFVLHCSCGVYTTAPFNELRHKARDLAARHGLAHGEYTVHGPFSEFIISEQP